MSKIATIIDEMRAEIALLSGFTVKTEIPNPYALDIDGDNSDLFLKDGWGLRLTSSSEPNNSEFNRTSTLQGFGIILTREVIRTAHTAEPMYTAIKAMFEDELTLRKYLLNPQSLVNTEADSRLSTTEIQTLLPLEEGGKKFITITVNFNLRISELL